MDLSALTRQVEELTRQVAALTSHRATPSRSRYRSNSLQRRDRYASTNSKEKGEAGQNDKFC